MTTYQLTHLGSGKSPSHRSGYPYEPPQRSPSSGELKRKHAAYARYRDPRLRAELIESHAGLATRLALPFAGRGEDLDDLVQVARMALMKALDRYDPDRGTSFATFATPTIRGELKRHFRDKGWALRVPRRLQELYLSGREAAGALRHELGRSPTTEEVARSVGEPAEEMARALEAGRNYWTLSLDAPSDHDGSGPAHQVGTEDGGMRQVEARVQLDRLLERLSDQERRVVRLRFFEELTQADIAAREGVSQMAISKTLTRVMYRLRREAA